jgi:hypothetical protein
MRLVEVADLLLSAGSPREAARKALSWLVEFHEARSAALWHAGDDNELTLEMGVALDEQAIVAARSLWNRDREALLSGTPSRDDHRALVPIRGERSFLYVDGVDSKRLDVEMIAGVAAVASKAMRRDHSAPGEKPMGLEGLRREELIATLRLHEWNIARVARVKGVTRKTIYDWLKRYQIPRERVSKA